MLEFPVVQLPNFKGEIMKIWLIGAGGMAEAYNKVLSDIECEYVVIGRGEASATAFQKNTGVPVITGGVDAYIASGAELPDAAIVSTGVEALAENTSSLITAGVKRLLIEKPGGLHEKQINDLYKLSQIQNSEVFVAYNRRFYSSVLKAQEIIEDDGGIESFNFEFTEWGHTIEPLIKGEGVKENWFFANSTHVVDLAFFLGGKPKDLSAYTAGKLSWHSRSSNFSGAGISTKGALFSYHANWGAPGRWSVEVLTKKHRLIFRPMEKLHVTKIGSVAIEAIEIDDSLDLIYKPGLYKQVKAFINNDPKGLCSLNQQVDMLPVFNKMAGYNE